jgi:hypothetical protein
LHLKAARWSVGAPALSHVANGKHFFSKFLLLPAHRYPSGKTSLFAAHGAPLIVLFALFLTFFRQKKAIAESTLKADNIGRTLLRDLARVLEASGTETVRGPFSLP